MTQTPDYDLSDVGKLFQKAMTRAKEAIESKSGMGLEGKAKKWLIEERENAVRHVEKEFKKIDRMRDGNLNEECATYLSDDPSICISTRKVPASLMQYVPAFARSLKELFEMFEFKEVYIDTDLTGGGTIGIMLDLHPVERTLIEHLQIEDQYTIFAEKKKRGEAVNSDSLRILDLLGKASRPILSKNTGRKAKKAVNGNDVKKQEEEGVWVDVKQEDSEEEEKTGSSAGRGNGAVSEITSTIKKEE